MLFGQVKRSGHIAKPRKIWNNVVLSVVHHLSIFPLSSCADQVCLASSDLLHMHLVLAHVVIIVNINAACLRCLI